MTGPFHTPARLRSETFLATIDGHRVHFTLSRAAGGYVEEIAFSTAGKIGTTIDQMMVDLGIAVSRAIQGRDPETGETLITAQADQ